MPKAIDRRRLGTSNDADALLWLRMPERAWTMWSVNSFSIAFVHGTIRH
jgi:hypothetical protein